MWTFPGGGIEFGESSDHAVVRETKEETGLEITPTKLIKVHEMIVPENKVHRIIFFYLAKVVGGELKTTEEISEWRWMTPDDIAKLDNLGHSVIEIMREAKLIK